MASAESRPLIDCGRFRLVKGQSGELKEEEIQNASEWGDTEDQVESMVDEEAGRAAA